MRSWCSERAFSDRQITESRSLSWPLFFRSVQGIRDRPSASTSAKVVEGQAAELGRRCGSSGLHSGFRALQLLLPVELALGGPFDGAALLLQLPGSSLHSKGYF